MKEFWMYTAIFFSGSTIIEFLIILAQMKKMGDQINIKKQVQRNRKSPNNTQEYQATQENKDKKKLFNLKRRNHEK